MRDFLTDVENFLARHQAAGITATRLGKEAIGDPAFVGDLRRGRSPRLKTAQAVTAWMDKQDKRLAKASKPKASRPRKARAATLAASTAA